MDNKPEWLRDLITRLKLIWPLDRPLNVIINNSFDLYGFPDLVDGICQIQPEMITIWLREPIEDSEYWRDVFLHEWAHAVLAPVTESSEQNEEFVAAVEQIAKRLGGLLDFVVRREEIHEMEIST